MRVRINKECTVFYNTIRYIFNEGWHDVEEPVLKRLYALKAVASVAPQLDDIEKKDDKTVLEYKRRGRPKLVHATE